MMDRLRNNKEIWEIFNRKEEYQPVMTDQYDRFPYYASRIRNIFEPVVSSYLLHNGFHIEYPDDKPFALSLSHDIDDVYTPITRKGIDTVRKLIKGEVKNAFQQIMEMRSKRISLCNFGEIMDIEERYGARSSFFFKAQTPEDQDYEYSIDDMQGEMGTILDRGWEIGLHGGFESYKDPLQIYREKELLERCINRKVTGFRNHYLCFKIPDTWEYLCSAGFEYDTTLGYADCTGFRNGMCHPFRPFNLNTEKEVNITEIPLTIMDRTLFSYMRLDIGRAWYLTKKIIDTVEQLHGVVTLVWHNDSFSGENKRLYEKILEYCHERGAWMTSGHQIMRNARFGFL